MLVLTRKRNETVEVEIDLSQIDPADLIDGKLRMSVTVISIQGCRARLGLEAPASAHIHRGEVAARMRDEAAAANTAR